MNPHPTLEVISDTPRYRRVTHTLRDVSRVSIVSQVSYISSPAGYLPSHRDKTSRGISNGI